jgi:predicted cupin superfamily sugar epimerase
MLNAAALIERLRLEPLPVEGGYFRETWVSADMLPATACDRRDGRAKRAGTAIYYLLTSEPDCFSALHRLPTDEIYHFYLGDPVEQWLLHADGRVEVVVLGQDVLAGQRVQHVAPGGVWQGSRLVAGGRLALLGTTMAPGFDPLDYEPGDREALIASYPAAANAVRALTRL